MFETVVIATDGSQSAERGVLTALDIAERFGSDVHALYIVDEDEIDASPGAIREDLEAALRSVGDEAVAFVEASAPEASVATAVREGDPADEIIAYGRDMGADLVAMGTRGRHGDHAFLLGSVAEDVVRRAPMPVLTVRQLDADEAA